MSEYLSMGGYAAYVWPAYALAAAALAGMTVASLRLLRRRAAELAELEARRPQRRRKAA